VDRPTKTSERSKEAASMLRLTRWCIARRRTVVLGWVAIAILTSVLAQAVGRNYTTVFSLPGTESQHAADLLTREFAAQSGDVDTIVFRVSHGTVDSPAVKSVMTPLITDLRTLPHVAGVISPYSSRGAVQVSPHRMTAFATINYDKRANLLPNNTGTPLLNAVKSVHVPGLSVAAGGQVVEQAEGFSVGPATEVGVFAALIILLFTFGSLTAAGMPLVTAGLGLITGVALIGLATHVTSMSNISPQLALMIGLGVGIDYALFIVTRFRENYLAFGDVERAVVEAMDTSGRAILLAGTTVVIALLGMFATGVAFMYGLALASVLAVVLVLAASLTVLPALLSRFGPRLVRPRTSRRRRTGRRASPAAATVDGTAAMVDGAAAAAMGDGTAAAVAVNGAASSRSAWRRWSQMVQSRPWPLAIVSGAVMVGLLLPVFAMRLETSDAGNDPANVSSRHAYDLLAQGFGPGFNGPLLLVAELPARETGSLPALRAAVAGTPGVVAVTQPRLGPSGTIAVMDVYPASSPQAQATTVLVTHLRSDVLPQLKRRTGMPVLVGGFTAGSIDFSNVLASKLPLFIGIVVVLSALLLLVIFRSLVIPLQAAVMNLLSIGGALGVTVAVFQDGVLGSVLGVQKGPVEPWIPVLMFAVVFGLSMDYEVFLISRVREEWVRQRDASAAVADGIAFTGRVISAAAAIMVCVFLSFMLGNLRTIREFGFGLAAAVFLDALVVRCVLLPAVLELLGTVTWRLPRWLDTRLPRINIEGTTARALSAPEDVQLDGSSERDTSPVGSSGR
jgi:RND superfamily putative drug exporter